jgi:hypothetical protein
MTARTLNTGLSRGQASPAAGIAERPGSPRVRTTAAPKGAGACLRPQAEFAPASRRPHGRGSAAERGDRRGAPDPAACTEVPGQ